MTRLAGELEGAGASGYLTRVPGLLDRLERDFGRVRTALDGARTRTVCDRRELRHHLHEGTDTMTSDNKAEANRRNALKSTGPSTPEGKAAVHLNALRHGLRSEQILLPGEDKEA